jgi:hypothetical protein
MDECPRVRWLHASFRGDALKSRDIAEAFPVLLVQCLSCIFPDFDTISFFVHCSSTGS